MLSLLSIRNENMRSDHDAGRKRRPQLPLGHCA